jgi:hypothetical protein
MNGAFLKARFPYMFEGDHIGLTFYRGWTPILGRACEHIDGLLPPNKLGFRWIQLRADRGCGLFLYVLAEFRTFVLDLEGDTRRSMMLAAYDVAADLTRQVDRVVLEAERMTGTACMVCGRSAAPASYFGTELTLCNLHRPSALARNGDEGLEGFWREAVEWEAPPS